MMSYIAISIPIILVAVAELTIALRMSMRNKAIREAKKLFLLGSLALFINGLFMSFKAVFVFITQRQLSEIESVTYLTSIMFYLFAPATTLLVALIVQNKSTAVKLIGFGLGVFLIAVTGVLYILSLMVEAHWL